MNRTAALLTSDSYRQLGFREYPFSASADPRFLFLSSQHEAVLDNVHRSISNRQGLTVVEGPVGLGKTSLARRLFDIYSPLEEYLTVYIHTATYKSAYAAMTDIASKFGLEPRRSEAKLRDAFEQWLVQQKREERTPVIIVDDAQLISSDSLDAFQYIYNFDVRQKLAQVILFGQTELREIIVRNTGLFSRVFSWQTLISLSASDALSLVNFRCQVAGRTEPLLNESAFTLLYEYSGGVPRTIVFICGEILSFLLRHNRYSADAAIVTEAIASYQRRPDAKPMNNEKPAPPVRLPAAAQSKPHSRRTRTGARAKRGQR
jgi:type II secretory pathway predicted ATPase ExeA